MNKSIIGQRDRALRKKSKALDNACRIVRQGGNLRKAKSWMNARLKWHEFWWRYEWRAISLKQNRKS